MNWQHLRAFLWLRWRLASHQRKRAGAFVNAVQTVFYVFGVLVAVGGFVGALALGNVVLAKQPPPVVMLACDGFVVAFLFFWMIGMLAELQRSELLSMEKFLHLPVSLTGVFLINYAAAIITPSVIVFVPAMLGLSIGLVASKGLSLLPMIPLVIAFTLMLTAITYQFRGWLASLMVNQRRRRMIVAIATTSFIAVTQLPNLARFLPWRKLLPWLPSGPTSFEKVAALATVVNAVVPLGWFPYGALAAAEGAFGKAALAALGMTLIAALSLRRSYRTTMRLYTGELNSGSLRTAKPRERVETSRPVAAAIPGTAAFLERRLPRVSEQASIVALSCFRSLTRAPESKMILLPSVFLVFLFCSWTVKWANGASQFARPLTASGAIVMVLFSIVQLAGNQFGYDRNGFRNFVLSPAPRKDILLGKNLSLAPLGIGMALMAVIVMQVFVPMRADHFVAVVAQMISMFLVYCLIANLLSIIAPTPIAAGSLRPAKPKGMTILIHMGFTFLFPIALAPTLIPLGIEFALSSFGYHTRLPVYLIFSFVELAVVGLLYPVALQKEGDLLARREQKILEVITAQAE